MLIKEFRRRCFFIYFQIFIMIFLLLLAVTKLAAGRKYWRAAPTSISSDDKRNYLANNGATLV